jgi:hypothetical protein
MLRKYLDIEKFEVSEQSNNLNNEEFWIFYRSVTIVIVMKYRRLYAIRSFYGYLMEWKLSVGQPC